MTPAPTTPASVAEVLDRAADLIEPEGAWVQGHFARTANGDALENGFDYGAVCFCALGAIEHVTDGGLLLGRARFAVQDVVGRSITSFNDAPERTQAEVVAALRSAAEAARGEGK